MKRNTTIALSLLLATGGAQAREIFPGCEPTVEAVANSYFDDSGASMIQKVLAANKSAFKETSKVAVREVSAKNEIKDFGASVRDQVNASLSKFAEKQSCISPKAQFKKGVCTLGDSTVPFVGKDARATVFVDPETQKVTKVLVEIYHFWRASKKEAFMASHTLTLNVPSGDVVDEELTVNSTVPRSGEFRRTDSLGAVDGIPIAMGKSEYVASRVKQQCGDKSVASILPEKLESVSDNSRKVCELCGPPPREPTPEDLAKAVNGMSLH